MDVSQAVTMTDANGGEGMLAGLIENVELTSGGLSTRANLYVKSGTPFEVLLGRPWQRDHKVSIEERDDGTYIHITDPRPGGRQYEICALQEEDFARTSRRQAYAVITDKESPISLYQPQNNSLVTPITSPEALRDIVMDHLSSPTLISGPDQPVAISLTSAKNIGIIPLENNARIELNNSCNWKTIVFEPPDHNEANYSSSNDNAEIYFNNSLNYNNEFTVEQWKKRNNDKAQQGSHDGLKNNRSPKLRSHSENSHNDIMSSEPPDTDDHTEFWLEKLRHALQKEKLEKDLNRKMRHRDHRKFRKSLLAPPALKPHQYYPPYTFLSQPTTRMPIMLLNDDPLVLGNGTATKRCGPVDGAVGNRTPFEVVRDSVNAARSRSDWGMPDFIRPSTLSTPSTVYLGRRRDIHSNPIEEFITMNAKLSVHNSETGTHAEIFGHAHITFYPEPELEHDRPWELNLPMRTDLQWEAISHYYHTQDFANPHDDASFHPSLVPAHLDPFRAPLLPEFPDFRTFSGNRRLDEDIAHVDPANDFADHLAVLLDHDRNGVIPKLSKIAPQDIQLVTHAEFELLQRVGDVILGLSNSWQDGIPLPEDLVWRQMIRSTGNGTSYTSYPDVERIFSLARKTWPEEMRAAGPPIVVEARPASLIVDIPTLDEIGSDWSSSPSYSPVSDPFLTDDDAMSDISSYSSFSSSSSPELENAVLPPTPPPSPLRRTQSTSNIVTIKKPFHLFRSPINFDMETSSDDSMSTSEDEEDFDIFDSPLLLAPRTSPVPLPTDANESLNSGEDDERIRNTLVDVVNNVDAKSEPASSTSSPLPPLPLRIAQDTVPTLKLTDLSSNTRTFTPEDLSMPVLAPTLISVPPPWFCTNITQKSFPPIAIIPVLFPLPPVPPPTPIHGLFSPQPTPLHVFMCKSLLCSYTCLHPLPFSPNSMQYYIQPLYMHSPSLSVLPNDFDATRNVPTNIVLPFASSPAVISLHQYAVAQASADVLVMHLHLQAMLGHIFWNANAYI
ncbi:hypothetical protein BDQ17DRAFT_1454707 [Cyathus striatus]|nr:hypothetical protein BDQ17DRAFT_1454707 [Cyathus striatus]